MFYLIILMHFTSNTKILFWMQKKFIILFININEIKTSIYIKLYKKISSLMLTLNMFVHFAKNIQY